MGNQLPEDIRNDDKEEGSEKSQGNDSGRGVLLQYQLTPLVDAAAFTIQRQSSQVTDFVRRLGVFQATNGVRIMLCNVHPEWKESLNIIYLDNGSGKGLNRPDITRFPVTKRAGSYSVRNNHMALFNAAMSELVDTVKANTSTVIYESQNKSITGKVTLK